jgi:hypothetical protein
MQNLAHNAGKRPCSAPKCRDRDAREHRRSHPGRDNFPRSGADAPRSERRPLPSGRSAVQRRRRPPKRGDDDDHVGPAGAGWLRGGDPHAAAGARHPRTFTAARSRSPPPGAADTTLRGNDGRSRDRPPGERNPNGRGAPGLATSAGAAADGWSADGWNADGCRACSDADDERCAERLRTNPTRAGSGTTAGVGSPATTRRAPRAHHRHPERTATNALTSPTHPETKMQPATPSQAAHHVRMLPPLGRARLSCCWRRKSTGSRTTGRSPHNLRSRHTR